MPAPVRNWSALLDELRTDRDRIALGGGTAAIERQHAKGRLSARERIAALIDPGTEFFELGRFAAWNMYRDWGGAPAAGVVCGLARIASRWFMVIANDATVKAGAFFPATAKKVLRAQRMALVDRLPLVYLVDSAGVFLPLQDEVFPDEDDFGRIFRNNAVLSALGVPQLAAIMGNCVAGGGYLPVLCDKLVMTEGSGLYLAGPALVKSAIGQEVSHEDLGGARMHASVSGTIDFREPDDAACLARIRRLAETLPHDPRAAQFRWDGRLGTDADAGEKKKSKKNKKRDDGADDAAGSWIERLCGGVPPERDDPASVVPVDPQAPYEMRDLIACLVDAGSFQEYKADYGRTLVCGYARIGGCAVGIVANQHHPEKTPREGIQFGGVIYHDGADKAARFVLDCNQTWTPLVFLQDVYGFMVGRDSEQAGIIRAGAKLVNVISNSRVPKITVIVGGSYGAGNYALCGKAFDPRFLFAWPTACYAVMGARQAAATLLDVNISALRRAGHEPDAAELEDLRRRVEASYTEQTDVRYAAARGWVDEIVEPARTREALLVALLTATRHADDVPLRTGVLQV